MDKTCHGILEQLIINKIHQMTVLCNNIVTNELLHVLVLLNCHWYASNRCNICIVSESKPKYVAYG